MLRVIMEISYLQLQEEPLIHGKEAVTPAATWKENTLSSPPFYLQMSFHT